MKSIHPTAMPSGRPAIALARGQLIVALVTGTTRGRGPRGASTGGGAGLYSDLIRRCNFPPKYPMENLKWSMFSNGSFPNRAATGPGPTGPVGSGRLANRPATGPVGQPGRNRAGCQPGRQPARLANRAATGPVGNRPATGLSGTCDRAGCGLSGTCDRAGCGPINRAGNRAGCFGS